MSYVVRSKTISKAQALLRDLRANLKNTKFYESEIEVYFDYQLKELLENWITVMEPSKDETKVVK